VLALKNGLLEQDWIKSDPVDYTNARLPPMFLFLQKTRIAAYAGFAVAISAPGC
jgi:hypothetical protein